MTLNVQVNGKAILSAYNDVARSPTCDNWIILDYEGNSNVLKLGDSGDGGLEELSTSFNSGKLQYGVAAVPSRATSQPKIILIQWQGEGVPSSRLAATTSHANDLKRFLRGIHVIITARSEVDVDLESIHRILSKLPSMNDDARQAGDNEFVQPGPVGSVYTPVRPNRDINLSERDSFWKKMEEEEANRIIEERRREHEKNELAKREKDALNEELHAKLQLEEETRRIRNSTSTSSAAQSRDKGPENEGLIRGRKAMFEQKIKEENAQHAPGPRETHREVIRQAPRTFASTHIEEEKQNGLSTSEIGKATPGNSSANGVQTTAPRRSASPQAQFRVPSPSPLPTSPSKVETPAPAQYSEPQTAASPSVMYEQPPAEEVSASGGGLRAIALWDYQAADETEITFDPDDIITEIDQIDEGWWRGRGPDGQVGLFPANYVSLL